MMPAIEDMVTREAMPAREAMRDNRGAIAGESRRRISYANGIPSENAGQLLVFHGNRIYNMDCSFTPPKAKDPLSACNAAGPSNTPRRMSPMVRLRYTTYLTTSYAIRIPPILRIAGDISTSGGQS